MFSSEIFARDGREALENLMKLRREAKEADRQQLQQSIDEERRFFVKKVIVA